MKRQIILQSDSDQSYQRENAAMWEKLTLFSSFLGGGGMVSFAGDSRSTVEHAKSGHSCSMFFFFFQQQQLPHFQKELLKLILAASPLTHFPEKQLDRANL